jgi:hypothetical protein
VLACYRALGHGGWEAPSLGLLFGGALVVLADLFRVPLAEPVPSSASGLRGARLAGSAVWPATGIVVAVLTYLFWGASEKTFIYFRF